MPGATPETEAKVLRRAAGDKPTECQGGGSRATIGTGRRRSSGSRMCRCRVPVGTSSGQGPVPVRFVAVNVCASPATVQVWVVPHAGHTQGLATAPRAWETHVIGFLNATLHPNSTTAGQGAGNRLNR